MKEVSLHNQCCNQQRSNYNPNLKRFGLYLFIFSLFSSLVCLLFWANIHLSQTEEVKSFKDIFISFFKLYGDHNNPYDVSYEPFKRIIWINLAGILSGIALTIASAISQSLTQNPLADATTLGMVDASIFGIILMKTFFADSLISGQYHLFYFLFSFFGSSIILVFCIVFLKETQ